MPKSTGKVEVLCSKEHFIATIRDVTAYPEYVEEMKEVSIIEETDSGAKVSFLVEVNVGGMVIKTEYTLAYTYNDDGVSWDLVESPNLVKNAGSWKVEVVDDEECVAYYEAEIETNLPIPLEVQQMFAEQEMPKMLETFQERAEDTAD